MIIACPACATRYVVPDSAIGEDGRTVRCAKCRHSWFQDGHNMAESPDQPKATAKPASEARPGFSDTHMSEQQAVPQTEVPTPHTDHTPTPVAPDHQSENTQSEATHTPIAPEAEEADEPTVPAGGKADSALAEQSYHEQPTPISPDAPSIIGGQDSDIEEKVATTAPLSRSSVEPAPITAQFQGDHSHFDREPPFRPRSNPLKIWTAAAAMFAVLAISTVIAVSYYGVPEWVPVSRPTFGVNEPDLVLDFPDDQQDRRTLPDGTEFFGASGKITNVGSETHTVPSILIIMRDQRERPVFSWVVEPSKSRLAPGESVTINEAAVNVPKSAKVAEIGWKPG